MIISRLITSIEAAMGLVMKTDKSLREMERVLRKFDSARGPRIMAKSIGGRGKPPLSMRYPRKPNAVITQRSKLELLVAYPPMAQSTRTMGIRIGVGTCTIFPAIRTAMSPITSMITWATKKLAKIPLTTVECSVNSKGPGASH